MPESKSNCCLFNLFSIAIVGFRNKVSDFVVIKFTVTIIFNFRIVIEFVPLAVSLRA